MFKELNYFRIGRRVGMDLNICIRYGISIVTIILVFFVIIVNYKRMKSVVKNRLLIFFLALTLVLVDIIIKLILGNENIFVIIIRSIIYPVSISIFIYLILSRKQKA